MSASRKNGHDTYQCASGTHSYSRKREMLDGPILTLVGDVVLGLHTAGLLPVASVAVASDPQSAERARLATELEALPGLLGAGLLDGAGYAAGRAALLARLDALGAEDARGAVQARTLSSVGQYRALLAEWQRDPLAAEPLRAVVLEVVGHIDVLPARVYRKPDAADVFIHWAEWLPRRGMLPTQPSPVARA